MGKSPRTKKKYVIFSIVWIILLVGWIYWGNQEIQTTTYVIHSEKLEPALPPITIVQVSDLHNAAFGENQEKLIEKIKESAPDLIAVTGDLIDSNRTDISIAMEFIHEAVEIAPVYFVTGNHEVLSGKDYEELKLRLVDAGVNLLDGRSEHLSLKGQQIYMKGIEDPSFLETALLEGNQALIDDALTDNSLTDGVGSDLPRDRAVFTIVLSHRPELFQSYVENEMDLVLTGHAHGGQFRLPLLGGIVAPNQGLFPKYTSGTFQEGDTTMIVSRGLGNSIIPVRINNRPELVVIRLESGRS